MGKKELSNLEKLEDIFRIEFGPPHYSDDFVKVTRSFGTLKIRIDTKEVEIDENLKLINSKRLPCPCPLCKPKYKEIKP